jgi:hypothetical protein
VNGLIFCVYTRRRYMHICEVIVYMACMDFVRVIIFEIPILSTTIGCGNMPTASSLFINSTQGTLFFLNMYKR